MANIHPFKLSLSTSHSEDFHSTRAEHISLWSFQIPSTGMWRLYHTSFQPAGEICAFYLKAFSLSTSILLGWRIKPSSNSTVFKSGSIQQLWKHQRQSLTLPELDCCISFTGRQIPMYTFPLSSNTDFGLVDGLNYQPKASALTIECLTSQEWESIHYKLLL